MGDLLQVAFLDVVLPHVGRGRRISKVKTIVPTLETSIVEITPRISLNSVRALSARSIV